MSGMNNTPNIPLTRRLAESRPGLILGTALAAMWIAAMSAVDANACTATPFLWGFIAVIALAVLCILRGYKIVRLPLTSWVSLAAGVYFLVRAANGFSLTDNLADIGLILFAFVYYLAGVYCGQANNNRGTVIVLSVALLLNLLCLWLLRDPQISLHYIGRADIGLFGPHTRNTTLFAYKNFAGLFLALGGGLLLWRCIWRGERNLSTLLQLAVAAGAIIGSFFCSTRVPYAILPLLLIAGWLLWFIQRLYSGRPLSIAMIGTGILLLVAVLIGIYDLFFGNTVLQAIVDIDSHQRFTMWEWVNSVVREAPLHGYGPAGATWYSITICNQYHLMNYAHNEYMQVWTDYGIIGLGLMLLIIVLHIIAGFRGLSADTLPAERRIRLSMALLSLVALCGAAIADYVWHSAALLSMGAFACGTLASPTPVEPRALVRRKKWCSGSSPIHPVRAESSCGRVIICAGALSLAACMGKLSAILCPPWLAQWQYDAMVARGATTEQRRAHLLQTMLIYPHHRLADHYINLAPKTHPDWHAYEQGIRAVLQANPQQLITASMLAQCLGKQARYREAEIVFRTYYPGDGPDNTRLNPWATFYTANLQQWGQAELTKGNLGAALSMLLYAEKMSKMTGYIPHIWHRGGIKTWGFNTPEQKLHQSVCKTTLHTLRAINPPQDHSWQQPLTPGGKPALYQRYQKHTK